MAAVLVWRPDVPQRSVTTLHGHSYVWHYHRDTHRLWSHDAGAECPYCTRDADEAPQEGAA